MLVGGDLGFWLSVVVGTFLVVVGFLARRKWRRAVARGEEIKRLAVLASEEAARYELEVKAGYGYGNGYGYGYVEGYGNGNSYGYGNGYVEGYGNGYGYDYGYAFPAKVEDRDHMSDVALGPTEVAAVEVQAPTGNLQSLLYPCAVCSTLTKARCKKCKAIHYCSGKCQIIHWRQGHKNECHSYSTLYHNNDLGGTSPLKASMEEEDRTHGNGTEMEGYHSATSVASSFGERTLSNSGSSVAHDGKSYVELEHVVNERGRRPITEFTCNSSSSASTHIGFRGSQFDASHDFNLSDRKLSNNHDDDKIWTGSDNFEQTKPFVSEHSALDSSVDSVDTLSKSSHIKLGSVDADKSYIPSVSSISGGSDSVKSSHCDPSTSSSGFWEGNIVRGKSRIDARYDASHFCSSEADESSTLGSKSSSSKSAKLVSPLGISNANTVALGESHPMTSEIRKPTDDTNISVGGEGDLFFRKPSKLTPPETLNFIGGIGSSAEPISKPRGVVPPTSSAVQKSTSKEILRVNGLPSTSTEKLNFGVELINRSSHKLESRSIETLSLKVFEAPLSGNPGRDAVGSVKAMKNTSTKGEAACLLELGGHQQNAKNVLKTSAQGAVHQHKASTLARQNTLGASSEIVARYMGVFSYEVFVKLYNCNNFDLRPCGLVNCGNSCYANVVLQCLAFTPPLNAYFLQGLHSKSCEKKEWCFTCEIESLLLKARQGISPLTPIRIISHLQDIGSHLSDGTEEDAHEFLRYAIDAMQSICLKEAGMKESGAPEEVTTLIGLTFGGCLRSKIECMRCGGKSIRRERMMDLTVEIDGDIGTLEEALRQFTRAETLDGDNKYQCGRCKSYEKARKKLKVLEAPNVLSIVLKRFQSGRFGKLNKTIKFPEILNMAPYMSGTSDTSPIYRLYGVIVHLDTMNAAFSGHYVCYVKNLQNKWFKVDDSRVKPVELEKVLTKGAYMLLYARCSPRSPRLIRIPSVPRDSRHSSSCVSSGNPANGHPRHESTNGTTLDEDSFSDNSSYFSEVGSGSQSTDSSRRDSTDHIDHMLGDMGVCCNSTWTNSSDSDTSSSSSPSPVFSRRSPLSESDRYASGCPKNSASGMNNAVPGSDGHHFWARPSCNSSKPEVSCPDSTKQFRNLVSSSSTNNLGRINPFDKVKSVVTFRRSTSDRTGSFY